MRSKFSKLDEITRRRLIGIGAALPAVSAMASIWPLGAAALEPTPACGKDTHPTPRSTEGPYYTPQAPRRQSLREPGLKGKPVSLTGRVLTRSCRPVANVVVDLWHADGEGDYDNQGFRGRGTQLTDADGRYRFLTVEPGDYPGRVRHYHIKVIAPDRPALTTQLYFPAAQGNARDFLFKPQLLLKIDTGADGRIASFDFVLDMA